MADLVCPQLLSQSRQYLHKWDECIRHFYYPQSFVERKYSAEDEAEYNKSENNLHEKYADIIHYTQNLVQH